MENTELIKALKEDAEWAHANEWETPITLGDHLDAAVNALESLQAQLAAERAKYAELQRYNVDCTKACDRQMVEILELREQNAALAESQRRERAAVEEVTGICGQIDEDEYLRKAFCVHPGNEDCPSEKENGYVDVDDCVGRPLFENSWHGQEAGKGEAE